MMSALAQQRFYGRRKGHPLSATQNRRIQALLPPLLCNKTQLKQLHKQFTPNIRALALEIGFGAGEHLVAQAQANPHIGYLGIEIFENGIARLLADIETAGITNIRLFTDNVYDALPCLPANTFTRVYIFYPDPWPKQRHHKRRLISPPVLQILYHSLAPNGWLHFASDDADYVAWTLQRVQAHQGFVWPAEQANDWRTPPPGYVRTRYERKAIAAGRMPTHLHFQKIHLPNTH